MTARPTKTLSLAQARRIALAAQGFNDRRPSGRVDARHFRRALKRMTILQLDSVNALCRSHFLPMLARLGPYDRERLDDWIWRSRENVEFLSHEASITSMELLPLLRHRRRSWKGYTRFEEEEPDYLQAVLAEVTERGPLSVSDLSEGGDRSGPWWGHSKGKRALEVLYTSGRLAIHERTQSFLTRYDLPERVLPEDLRSAPPLAAPRAHKDMLLLGARSHGVGTAKDIADYFRLKTSVARPLVRELVEEGALAEVRVEGWKDLAYFHPDSVQPRRVSARTFLSPFDPVVWFRPRAERLFDFHYRIEIYVPEAKRVHGYYVLPFLLGDELVGRADLKADRKTGRLVVQASFLEPGQDPERVASAMTESLREMAGFLGLDTVDARPKGDLNAALRSALR